VGPLPDPADIANATREADEAIAEAQTGADPADAMNETRITNAILEEAHDRFRGEAQPVAATQLQNERPDVSGMRFTFANFGMETGARRLMESTGYPVAMPTYLIELLDAARIEHQLDPDGPNGENTDFAIYMQSANDYLAPL
jgi:hypothetical protein